MSPKRKRRPPPRRGPSKAAQPRASDQASYSELLAAVEGHGPAAIKLLRDADRLRAARLLELLTSVPPAIGAFHELFGYLDDVAEALRGDGCSTIAQVVSAARWDVEMCLEASLAGRPAICFDRCRHLMEIELLLHEFAIHPETVSEWERADDKTRRNRFGHGQLRQKIGNELGLSKQMWLADHFEYATHSQLLHLSPDGVKTGGFVEGDEYPLQVLLGEIFSHVDRVLAPINEFLGTRPNLRDQPPHNVMPAGLAEVLDAHHDAAIELQAAMGFDPRQPYHQDHPPGLHGREPNGDTGTVA